MYQRVFVLRFAASRTLGTLSLAGLMTAGLAAELVASPLQEAPRDRTGVERPDPPTVDPVHTVAQRLLRANDAQFDAFRQRWGSLPDDYQQLLVLAVRDHDSDRGLELLVAMLDAPDAAVRELVKDSLQSETGQRLPASRELWQRWLDSEKTWLRLRGTQVLQDLHSSDEAAVVVATREVAQRRIHKRAFADELERNLGRLSPAIRSVTARALGELGDSGSRQALLGALGDRAPAVRREAQRALGRLEPDLG